MLAMGQRTTLTAEQIKGLGTAQENLKTTTDSTTSAMISANESMLKSAQALDALALQTTLPLAAKGIEVFTSGIETATKKLLEFAGMSAEEIKAKLEEKAGTNNNLNNFDTAAAAGVGGLSGAAAGAAAGAALGLIGGPLAPITSSLGAIAGGILGFVGGGFAAGSAAEAGFTPDFVDKLGDQMESVWNWVGNLGGKALGGPVSPGQAYVVGEKGPELLINRMAGTIMPNDQLSQMSDAANTRSNMIMPNDQLTKMSNIAGPANNYNSADFGSAVSANLPERTQPDEQPTANTAGSANNALMEASVNRLDQLVSAMSRNNDINTKILQAANR
jgi:outer membrane lipoprotein SlyB